MICNCNCNCNFHENILKKWGKNGEKNKRKRILLISYSENNKKLENPFNSLSMFFMVKFI